MQAIVWSPNLSDVIKNLKQSERFVASAFEQKELSQGEQKAIRKTFSSDSKKVEAAAEWY
ncbi:hypothetical protein [Paenibacillus contaminans]|uniref:Uncharacterized protein n=1 Tax=Paenibacillus contaminans TaxID=450362 RepID=A0A329MAE1_9BACL|nr:hypothetical protein [Paenibacillus contaminans]RAV15533.1 hypothetical protein DQG23_29560 [Paenibacillus contaminans]